MTTHTRRAAIGAIGSIAAAGLIAGHAAKAAQPDTAIELLWSKTKAQLLAIKAVDLDDDKATVSHWNAVSVLEQAVAEYPDSSTRAAEIKLWIAFNHSTGWGNAQSIANEDVVAREDSTLLRTILRDLDFDAKCIAYAILALRGEA